MALSGSDDTDELANLGDLVFFAEKKRGNANGIFMGFDLRLLNL